MNAALLNTPQLSGDISLNAHLNGQAQWLQELPSISGDVGIGKKHYGGKVYWLQNLPSISGDVGIGKKHYGGEIHWNQLQNLKPIDINANVNIGGHNYGGDVHFDALQNMIPITIKGGYTDGDLKMGGEVDYANHELAAKGGIQKGALAAGGEADYTKGQLATKYGVDLGGLKMGGAKNMTLPFQNLWSVSGDVGIGKKHYGGEIYGLQNLKDIELDTLNSDGFGSGFHVGGSGGAGSTDNVRIGNFNQMGFKTKDVIGSDTTHTNVDIKKFNSNAFDGTLVIHLI